MPSLSMSWTMPTLSVGEDATSQERHLKQLHLEMKQVNPNKHITQELMLRTFSTRRQEIVNEGGSVGVVIEISTTEGIMEFSSLMAFGAMALWPY